MRFEEIVLRPALLPFPVPPGTRHLQAAELAAHGIELGPGRLRIEAIDYEHLVQQIGILLFTMEQDLARDNVAWRARRMEKDLVSGHGSYSCCSASRGGTPP